MNLDEFLQIDLPALLTILLCAVSCSVLGSLLLLRKESMLSDSLSHAVLPGLAVAFLVTGSIAPWAMVLGALAGLQVVVLRLRNLGQVMEADCLQVVRPTDEAAHSEPLLQPVRAGL